MIRKFAKLLPYWIIIKFVKKFGAEFITTPLGKCRGWRLDEGEWIVWSQQNYDRMTENRRKAEEYDELHAEEQEKKEYERLKNKFS